MSTISGPAVTVWSFYQELTNRALGFQITRATLNFPLDPTTIHHLRLHRIPESPKTTPTRLIMYSEGPQGLFRPYGSLQNVLAHYFPKGV